MYTRTGGQMGTCNNNEFLFLEFDTEHPIMLNAAQQVPNYGLCLH